MQQHGDIVAADLEAGGLLDGERGGLVRSLLQHGGESEELALAGLIHQHLLVIFVDGCHPHLPRHHHVGVFAGLSHLVDALAGSELLQLDLRGQYSQLIVVQQSEQRDLFQCIGVTCHGSPRFDYCALCSAGRDYFCDIKSK